jgi:hypothetical protein
MAILGLPNELIFQIVDYLSSQRDINSVTRVSKRLYHLLNEYLYRYNILFRGSNALLWAARHGLEATARRLLHLGADIEAVRRDDSFPWNYWTSADQGDETPLHIAGRKGHLPIIKLLLEAGANTQAFTESGSTPLYRAIRAKNQKVARTIYHYSKNIPNSWVTFTGRLTPLHAASKFGVPELALHFLENGAEVDSRDERDRTPLYYAVDHLDPQVIRVLLEFGSDPDLQMKDSHYSDHFTTPRKLASSCCCDETKLLLGVLNNNAKASRRVMRLVRIGRAWMGTLNCGDAGPILLPSQRRSTASENIVVSQSPGYVKDKCRTGNSLILVSSDCRQSDPRLSAGFANVESFPSLPSEQSYAHLVPSMSSGLWSTSNTDRLLAQLAMPDAPEEPQVVDPDPFPQLGNISYTPSHAGNAWREFRMQKTKETISNIPADESTTVKQRRTRGGQGKGKGKGRGQPLKF